MALRRFWVDQGEFEGQEMVISGDLFHHIFDVCRFREGQEFELLIPPGAAYLVQVEEVHKKKARVRRVSTREIPDLPRPHIHLAVSLAKYQTMDTIVEKAVELGVKSLHPFVSDFSFVRTVGQFPTQKIERWQKIIRQATQQTGRGELMSLEPLAPLTDILRSFNPNGKVLGLFPYEGECASTLRQELRAQLLDQFDEVWLFVGSEGGFSEDEVKFFKQSGMEPLSFGDQVLRVETACVALLGVLKYELEPKSKS